MPPVIIGPRCNRRVTCDASPNNARSESFIAVNPLDPYNMVASSKRFTDPAHYGFSLAAYTTFDGGEVLKKFDIPKTVLKQQVLALRRRMQKKTWFNSSLK